MKVRLISDYICVCEIETDINIQLEDKIIYKNKVYLVDDREINLQEKGSYMNIYATKITSD